MFFIDAFLAILHGLAQILVVPSKICEMLADRIKNYTVQSPENAAVTGWALGIVVSVIIVVISGVYLTSGTTEKPQELRAESEALKAIPAIQAPQASLTPIPTPTASPTPDPEEVEADLQTKVMEIESEIEENKAELKTATKEEAAEIQQAIKGAEAELKQARAELR